MATARVWEKSQRSADADGNVLRFEERVQAFAAKLASPAAPLQAAEGTLRRRGHAVADADGAGFEQ